MTTDFLLVQKIRNGNNQEYAEDIVQETFVRFFGALMSGAIGSMSYTDAEGQSHTGIESGRLLAEDVNQWKGELTAEKISEVINDYKTLSAKYSDEIPNAEYGKTVQSYYDIYSFVIGILTTEYLYNLSGQYEENGGRVWYYA